MLRANNFIIDVQDYGVQVPMRFSSLPSRQKQTR